MVVTRAAILFLAVLVFAADSGAESHCMGDQQFGDDGRLTKWDVCESSRLIRFVDSGDDRFHVGL